MKVSCIFFYEGWRLLRGIGMGSDIFPRIRQWCAPVWLRIPKSTPQYQEARKNGGEWGGDDDVSPRKESHILTNIQFQHVFYQLSIPPLHPRLPMIVACPCRLRLNESIHFLFLSVINLLIYSIFEVKKIKNNVHCVPFLSLMFLYSRVRFPFINHPLAAALTETVSWIDQICLGSLPIADSNMSLYPRIIAKHLYTHKLFASQVIRKFLLDSFYLIFVQMLGYYSPTNFKLSFIFRVQKA